MIVGVGTDIVGLERIERLLTGPKGEAFERRILSEGERNFLKGMKARPLRRIEFIAGRWAAKEAVAKALGCGIGSALAFRDIEILPDERGRPLCKVARRIADGIRLHVSISHADGWVSAFAVAERTGAKARLTSEVFME